MSQTVIALFDKSTDAQNAVEQLVNEGLTRANIDVSTRTSTNDTYSSGNDYDDNRNNNNGNSHESGIGHFFRSLFGNDDEADTYTRVAGRAGSIVTVHAQSEEEAERAAEILDDAGAIDVDEKASQYGFAGTDRFATQGSADSTSESGSATIPIIEEDVQIGKREVETGGVRIRSRIIERPVEENLRLREEFVTVERNTVDRPATEAELQNFEDAEMEVIEHAEVPIVSKEARVVEEVKLNKEVQHREETVRETARKTDVDVENIEQKDVKNKKNKINK